MSQPSEEEFDNWISRISEANASVLDKEKQRKPTEEELRKAEEIFTEIHSTFWNQFKKLDDLRMQMLDLACDPSDNYSCPVKMGDLSDAMDFFYGLISEKRIGARNTK